ncbi:hypothetical protein GCM10010429_25510 [Micromonospora olivasterospora]
MRQPRNHVAQRALPLSRQDLRAVRRLPNDSMVVAFRAGAGVADVVRARAGAALFAATFRAPARVAVGLFGGAFLAAAAFAVGLRVGVVVVAEVSFFRATRVVVGFGFPPGVLARLAPVARFVAAATFFAAAVRFAGAFFAPVDFRALPAGTVLLPAVILTPPRPSRQRRPPHGRRPQPAASGRPNRSAGVFPRPRRANSRSEGPALVA